MQCEKSKIFSCQRGFSLIEVVASVVILTIILLSFFGLLIQSNKTGKSSEQIIDATLLAQREMEKMYVYFKSTSKASWAPSFPYTKDVVNSAGNTTLFGPDPLSDAKNNEVIKLKVEELSPENAVRVTIEIFDSDAKILKAKVENIFSF